LLLSESTTRQKAKKTMLKLAPPELKKYMDKKLISKYIGAMAIAVIN